MATAPAAARRRRALIFCAADGSGAELIIHTTADDYSDALAAWNEGRRWFDLATGEFSRTRPATSTVARSRTEASAPASRQPPIVRGPRGRFDLDGAEVPRTGRDRSRSSPVVIVSLEVGSELRSLAGEADDGLETGGFLFGRRSRDGEQIEIRASTRMAINRTDSSMAFDVEALRSHLAAQPTGRPARGGALLIGDWHTHPPRPSLGTPEASYEDQVAWLSLHDFYRANEDPRLPEWVSLILGAGSDGYAQAAIRGWITRRDPREGPETCKVAVLRP